MQRTHRSSLITSLVVSLMTAAATMSAQGAGLPAGTPIQVRLLEQLDTGQVQAGQTFTATVSNPVVVGGRTFLAGGAKVSGRVVEAVSSGRLKRPASLTLELTQAGRGAVSTEPLRIDGKSHLLRNAEIIGGEAGAGAIIGAALGGKEGAGIGAAIGAGAGTGTAYLTGKKEIVLPVETALTFTVASLGSPATASHGQQSSSGPSSQEGSFEGRREAAQSPSFSEHDQQLIRRYFAMNTSNLPPGLAKRGGHLPPGLEKHLEREGTLPPGLEKRVQPLPVELDRQLRPLPAGYARVVLEGRVLILDVHNRILDLMYTDGSGRHQEDEDRDEDRDRR